MPFQKGKLQGTMLCLERSLCSKCRRKVKVCLWRRPQSSEDKGSLRPQTCPHQQAPVSERPQTCIASPDPLVGESDTYHEHAEVRQMASHAKNSGLKVLLVAS